MKKVGALQKNHAESEYLECEQRWVYWLLITAAGWFGAYTFILRGGVFCNAQTANVVLFAIALGQQRWLDAAYLLIPIGAYFLGAFVSELLGKTVKRFHLLRWDTLLIGIEILVVLALGFLPASAPDQYFAALTNMRSVGVMGDERTYDNAIALRAVITSDFMTAESAEIPYPILHTVMNRIINEVRGVNRVFYDLTSKPPGTIEME